MKQIPKESSRSLKLQTALGKCAHRNSFKILYFYIVVNTIWCPGPSNLSYELSKWPSANKHN